MNELSQKNPKSFASALFYSKGYEARLAATLEEALSSAPAYKGWVPRDPGEGHSIFERLSSLPLLTKQDIRHHGVEAFVPGNRDMQRALDEGMIQTVHTSGTTGDKVANLWYQPWWDASEKASWEMNTLARAAVTGHHKEAILTSPYCTGFPCETGYLDREARTLGRFLYLCERSDPSLWEPSLMERMVLEINTFKPPVLEANPCFLARLSRFIVERKLKVFSPDLIVFTYENPSRLHYRQISETFTSHLASSYGTTEAGYVFMECEKGSLHQVTSHCHVDFLPFREEQGGPDIGCIYVTTFGNPWRSLLRFDTGDVVRLKPSSCPCGRKEGLTLESIEGRTVNLTSTLDGRAVTQASVDRGVSEIPGLFEYQLFQNGTRDYEIRFVCKEEDVKNTISALKETLLDLYGKEALIHPARVKSITPDPPGKYRLSRSLNPIEVKSLLNPDYLSL